MGSRTKACMQIRLVEPKLRNTSTNYASRIYIIRWWETSWLHVYRYVCRIELGYEFIQTNRRMYMIWLHKLVIHTNDNPWDINTYLNVTIVTDHLSLWSWQMLINTRHQRYILFLEKTYFKKNQNNKMTTLYFLTNAPCSR